MPGGGERAGIEWTEGDFASSFVPPLPPLPPLATECALDAPSAGAPPLPASGVQVGVAVEVAMAEMGAGDA